MAFLESFERGDKSVNESKAKKKKLTFTKGEKIFLGILIIIYIIVGIFNLKSMEPLTGVGERWIVTLPFGEGLLSRINPMTVIMSWLIMLILIVLAYRAGKKFSLIPGKFQLFMESLLEFIYSTVEDSTSKKEFVRPIFIIAATLFLFVVVSNVISGFPGVQVVPTDSGIKISLFEDTWYTPTSDINTNATYAVMVLIISHAFAIKVKGFGKWLKGFFEPNPIMFPMNIIGEIAKPISHSLRLFGNIAGGGILVLILSYMAKYMFIPVVLWGFFGIFVGVIQALVYSMLAIAYISSQIEE